METWTCIVPTSSTHVNGPLQGSMERPDRQDAHEILLVLDGPAEIGGGLSSVGGQPGSFLDRLVVEALAPQRAFRLPGLDRRQPHVGEPDAEDRKSTRLNSSH